MEAKNGQEQQQIPCGNGKQKSKDKGKGKCRYGDLSTAGQKRPCGRDDEICGGAKRAGSVVERGGRCAGAGGVAGPSTA